MNKLSGIWRRIQGSLFPRLDDALSSPMTDDHKKVAKILEIVRAEDVIRQPHQWTGRPAHEWALIGRAFVAKAVLGLTSDGRSVSGGHEGGVDVGGYRGTSRLRSAAGTDTRQEKGTQSENGSVRHGRREKDRLFQAESDIKKEHDLASGGFQKFLPEHRNNRVGNAFS